MITKNYIMLPPCIPHGKRQIPEKAWKADCIPSTGKGALAN